LIELIIFTSSSGKFCKVGTRSWWF